jgi:WXG100 family type VII secretion target
MSNKISVDHVQLKAQANVYNQACDDLDAARNRIDNMNGQITDQWKGQAFDGYMDQYAQVCTYFDKYRDLCRDIYTQLNNYADKMADRDYEDKQVFGLNNN